MNPDLVIMVKSRPVCDHPACGLHSTYRITIGANVTNLCSKHSFHLVEKAKITHQAVRIGLLKQYPESERVK